MWPTSDSVSLDFTGGASPCLPFSGPTATQNIWISLPVITTYFAFITNAICSQFLNAASPSYNLLLWVCLPIQVFEILRPSHFDHVSLVCLHLNWLCSLLFYFPLLLCNFFLLEVRSWMCNIPLCEREWLVRSARREMPLLARCRVYHPPLQDLEGEIKLDLTIISYIRTIPEFRVLLFAGRTWHTTNHPWIL